ncbi:MAG: nucleotidyltransferase [Clostridia bacterium]|nr:nucleotidyltransferase [Clostridia bacterium]
MIFIALGSDFKTFCNLIILDNRDDMESTAGEIAKKLNKHYYDIDSDSSSHMYIVGSVGRATAIKGSSDLDILFDLPQDVYIKYDNYSSNGQSALLQDVKALVQERYPRTEISGDGQVVVIAFDKYTVELVPGFQNKDGSFKYPDTHDGGSWKTTNPIPEQEECKACNDASSGLYFDFCHIIRSWKNNIGLSMGGLLIDTLVYDLFKDNSYFKGKGYFDYLSILTSVFEYLKGQNKDCTFWYAVGSSQKVYNTDNGAFVNKAKAAYERLSGTTNSTQGINDTLIDLLGIDFPAAESRTETASFDRYGYKRGTQKEQFIEELFPVDIRYSLRIDCNVTQDGFRSRFLSEILREHKWLSRKKQLDFQIMRTDCPMPYTIYWKVRNVGEVAKSRNMIRGEIRCTNNPHQKEHTDFYGPHYVECFLVKNGICVARARIDVPIE